MQRYDPHNYPAGKNRIEPVSVLVFSIIMGMAAIFLLYESINDLTSGLSEGGKQVKVDAVVISILAVVIGVQALMWIYCRRIAALPIPGASADDCSKNISNSVIKLLLMYGVIDRFSDEIDECSSIAH